MARYSRSAGRSVAKEMRHRKHGAHGAMSRLQAVAIGLNKARRGGKKVPPKS